MNIKPVEWSVVVIGRWNPAILTPSGIAGRVFGLPEGSPIECEINLDGPVVFRVTHEGISVQADFLRLVLDIKKYDAAHVSQAAVCAKHVIDDLPKTPVTAAGLNFRYRVEDPSPVILDLLTCKVDKNLADAGELIVDRTIRMGIKEGAGTINVQLDQNDKGEVFLGFNWHHGSKAIQDLKDWLGQPVEALLQKTRTIILNTFHANPEDIAND